MKLKNFFYKYHTVIFDMDGVITSEQNYWNAAALTVNEFLESSVYFGDMSIDAKSCMENTAEIRDRVFLGDRMIGLLKSKGVNSNWDLGYVVVCIALILNTHDYYKIYEYAEKLGDNILYEYDNIAKRCAEVIGKDEQYTGRSGGLWKDMHNCFQEWFLGDELFLKLYGKNPVTVGKRGLLYEEKPIIPMDDLKNVFRLLYESEKRICTGTGRPYYEISYPLKSWGILGYIAEDGFINYDHVTEAEKELNINALTKPHPYMFLKALFGENYNNEKIVKGEYDKERIKGTLVIGDAGADIMAAHSMGADFCAVLTGVSGKEARTYFESMNAEYILDSVSCFIEN